MKPPKFERGDIGIIIDLSDPDHGAIVRIVDIFREKFRHKIPEQYRYKIAPKTSWHDQTTSCIFLNESQLSIASAENLIRMNRYGSWECLYCNTSALLLESVEHGPDCPILKEKK